MHVSTMILRSPAVMANAWIDSTRLPSSSTKCGRSHDECDAITSSVALGRSPLAGIGVMLSCTRVMVTSPICHCRFSVNCASPGSVDGAAFFEHGHELRDATRSRLRALRVVDAPEDRVAVGAVKRVEGAARPGVA